MVHGSFIMKKKESRLLIAEDVKQDCVPHLSPDPSLGIELWVWFCFEVGLVFFLFGWLVVFFLFIEDGEKPVISE